MIVTELLAGLGSGKPGWCNPVTEAVVLKVPGLALTTIVPVQREKAFIGSGKLQVVVGRRALHPAGAEVIAVT